MLLASFALLLVLQDPSAEVAARTALAAAEAARGVDSVEVADAASHLGNRLVDAGDFAGAIAAFERALRIRKERLGEDDPKTRVALSNLANGHMANSEAGLALPLLERAIASFTRAGVEDRAKVGVLLSLGAAHKLSGQYRQSRAVLEDAVAVAGRVCDDHPYAALARQGLAMTLLDYGEIERTRELIALALATAEREPQSKPCAHAVFGLGLALGSAGRFDEALPLLRRGMELVQKAFGADSAKAVLSAAVLASLLCEAGLHDEAVATAAQLLLVAQGRTGLFSRARSRAHAVLSMVAAARGDAVEALAEARSMAALQDPNWTTTNDLAGQLAVLGKAQEAAGEHGRAIAAYRRAIACYEKDAAANGIGDGIGLVEVCSALAAALAASGDAAAAIAERQRALAAFRASVALMLPAMLERQRLQVVQRHRGNLDALLACAPSGTITAAQQHAEVLLWKGQVARGLERSIAAARQHPDTEAALARLQQLVRETGGDPKDTAVLRERQALSRMLAANGSLHDTEDLARVADGLAPGEALVDLLAIREEGGGRRFVAFVVRAGRTVRVDLPSHETIRAATASHLLITSRRTKAGLGGQAIATAAARAVHDAVWRPLLPALEGVTRVAISPDDVLAELPFETLPGSAADRYLVEDLEIVYLQSGLSLARKSQPDAARRLVAVGNVDYGLPHGGERAGPGPFTALPATKQELSDLQALFGDGAVTLLRSAEATEQRLAADVGGATYVHLATHGFCNTFGAGIALASANRGRRGGDGLADGILTSDEAALLDLRACRLVTLSACQSGLGTPVSGEHLLGLRRSLHIAGARATLTSLWRVDDAATAGLMADFYRALWRDGLTPALALRRVQIALLTSQRQAGEVLPGTWGGFVVEGR